MTTNKTWADAAWNATEWAGLIVLCLVMGQCAGCFR